MSAHNYENISMLLSGQNVRICMGINSSTLNLNIWTYNIYLNEIYLL